MKALKKNALSALLLVLAFLLPKSTYAASEPACLRNKDSIFQCVLDLAAVWQTIDIEYVELKLGATLVLSSRGNSPSGKLYRWRRDKNWLDLVLTDTNNRPGLTPAVLTLGLEERTAKDALCISRQAVVDSFGVEYTVLPMPSYHGALPGTNNSVSTENTVTSFEKAWGLSYKTKAAVAPRPILYFSFGTLDCLGEVAIQSAPE